MQTDDRYNSDIASLTALLDWYQAMGVDHVLADEPVDWLTRGNSAPGFGFALTSNSVPETQLTTPPPGQPTPPIQPPRQAPTPASAPARAFKPTAPESAELAARTAAANATTLEELEAALRGFEGCGLKATAKNLCFYRGATQARLMIIGEAPGRDEDIEGKPFVGRAGQLLDKMLAAIGMAEANVHITNVIYWRPPGNRTPTPQEAQICRPFLDRQIQLVAPEILLLLGGAATSNVLGVTDGIMKVRGKWRTATFGTHNVKVMATLHPDYLLRSPASKRLSWRDLLATQAALSANKQA